MPETLVMRNSSTENMMLPDVFIPVVYCSTTVKHFNPATDLTLINPPLEGDVDLGELRSRH